VFLLIASLEQPVAAQSVRDLAGGPKWRGLAVELNENHISAFSVAELEELATQEKWPEFVRIQILNLRRKPPEQTREISKGVLSWLSNQHPHLASFPENYPLEKRPAPSGVSSSKSQEEPSASTACAAQNKPIADPSLLRLLEPVTWPEKPEAVLEKPKTIPDDVVFFPTVGMAAYRLLNQNSIAAIPLLTARNQIDPACNVTPTSGTWYRSSNTAVRLDSKSMHAQVIRCSEGAREAAAAVFYDSKGGGIKCPQGCRPAMWMDADAHHGSTSFACSFKNTYGCLRDEGVEACGNQGLDHWRQVASSNGPSTVEGDVSRQQLALLKEGKWFPSLEHRCYEFYFKNNTKEKYLRRLGGLSPRLQCASGCRSKLDIIDHYDGFRSNNDMKPYVRCQTDVLQTQQRNQDGSLRTIAVYQPYFWYREYCVKQ
jgi:hypothetical protein